jgi:hypothetical protein
METEMNGMSASVQGCIPFSFSSSAFPCLRDDFTSSYRRTWFRHTKELPRRCSEHHLLYPAEFVPTPQASIPASGDTSNCMQATLSASSVTPIENSSFALSSIDNTCPEILRSARQLGPFIREQILRQLKHYGDPAITQAPTNYTIAGHPAAITVASVAIPADTGKVARMIYAAKACALGSIPLKARKKSDPVEPATHVLCFDFTTQNSGMLAQMFSFIIQFENTPLEPMFPGSVIRNTGGMSRR